MSERRSLLRRTDVRLIVVSVGASALGDFLLWVPLSLHLRQMTGSGIAVAAVLIALWAPVVVLTPVAGVIVDRNESRRVLIIASLCQAAIAAVLAFAVNSVAAILVLTTLLGVGFSVAQPAEFSLVPVIASGSRLAELNGHVETSRYLGMSVGPLLGGVLAGAGGTRIALLVNAASFVGVAVAGVLLRARRPPARSTDPEESAVRARDGVVYLFRDRLVAVVMAVVFVSLLFMTASATAEVFFLKGDLQASDAVYGLVFTGWTLGMVLGAAAVSRRVKSRGLALGALVAVAVQAVGLGLPTAWLAVGFAAGMWFIGGIGHGTKNVLARTLIQERVPDRVHGRAFAAYNGLRNAAELFALAAGGVLVVAIGARVTLALAGGIALLAALVGLVVYWRRRGRVGDVTGSELTLAEAAAGIDEPAIPA